MKINIFILIFCFITFGAWATQVPEKKLTELITESEYIIIGKVEKVDMIDDSGKEIRDNDGRTGPGLDNQIRLHVVVEKNNILKTSKKSLPEKVVIQLWKMWHYSLGQWKTEEGKTYIFLLKGDGPQTVYPDGFMRPVSEKAEIEKLLNLSPAPNTKLSKADVIRIAENTAKAEGYDVAKYNMMGCHYEFTHKDNTWTVFYELKPPTPPGGHFTVSIDDQTKKAILIKGE